MKRLSAACMVLIIVWTALTFNVRHSDAAACGNSPAISAVSHDYCLLLTRYGDDVPQFSTPRIRQFFTMPVVAFHVIIQERHWLDIHKTNMSFMARRNCVCVPLRL